MSDSAAVMDWEVRWERRRLSALDWLGRSRSSALEAAQEDRTRAEDPWNSRARYSAATAA